MSVAHIISASNWHYLY